MTRVALQLGEGAREPYRRAIARISGVALVAEEHADALIADSPEAAADTLLPCLLHDPHLCDADQLGALATQRVMPAHPWRFRPDVVAIHQSLTSGHLGEPGLLRIHDWCRSASGSRPGAVAQIDLAHSLFADRPDRSHGVVRPDYVQVHLGFPQGGMALIDVAQGLADDYFALHLIGSRGAAYCDGHHDQPLLLGGNGHPPNPTHTPLALAALLDEFFAGLEDDRLWSVGIEDTLAALATWKEVQGG